MGMLLGIDPLWFRCVVKLLHTVGCTLPLPVPSVPVTHAVAPRRVCDGIMRLLLTLVSWCIQGHISEFCGLTFTKGTRSWLLTDLSIRPAHLCSSGLIFSSAHSKKNYCHSLGVSVCSTKTLTLAITREQCDPGCSSSHHRRTCFKVNFTNFFTLL